MADITALRARNVEFWAQTAPGWVRQADRHDIWGRPLGVAAFDWLDPQPAERIVDIGCGCGGTTAELAAAVGPDGEAVGVDIDASMISCARSRFPDVRFVVGDCETGGIGPGAPFDAAYSRMTLMLLADPIAGCTAIRARLRTGGRLAATVFRDAASNPSLFASVLGAAPYVGALPPLPIGTEPGPFAFADAGRIERILSVASFGEVAITPHDVIMELPDEADTVAEWAIELGPAGAPYAAASPEDRTAARAGVARMYKRFRSPNVGYRIPSGIWLITAVAN